MSEMLPPIDPPTPPPPSTPPAAASIPWEAPDAKLGAIFPTIGAYLLTYWALARAESSLVALFVYLQPVIAGITGAIFLGERPALTTLAGGALIFAAVAFATRPESRRVYSDART